jgi:hypothetical protein
MAKYKEKYKTGMIFRSKEYPHFDIMIDFLWYMRDADTAGEFNTFSRICWVRANDEAFFRFVCERKGYTYPYTVEQGSTAPYPSFGEMTPKSLDAYLRKYNLQYVGMSDKEVVVYSDNENQYSTGFKID